MFLFSGIELSTRHWWIIVTVLLLAAAAGVGVPIALKISSSASFEERLEFATRLLQEVPLIDGHNDLPWNIRKFLHNKLKNFKFNEDLRNVSPWSTSAWSHTDLVRLEAGHVAAQVRTRHNFITSDGDFLLKANIDAIYFVH
ncbi:Peptidase M19 domain containing protein [Asbolus verrucosus]|uniref:Dipeptidase n=1 Tax=Asbolus verrucosus TaxID=1661398 RepID=A0A482VMF7_ASBVE|nr:Peptidase M19 domain containing protein [Asbolus verrucosus]